MLPSKSGIYSIVNKVNGKIYIGCAVDMCKRESLHKSQLEKGKHINRHLQRAWIEYGIGNFIFRVIEECDKADLFKREHFWAISFNSHNPEQGYNIKPTDPNGIGGISKETALNISKAKKGKSMSDAYKKQCSNRQKAKPPFMLGRKFSTEQRINLSVSHQGQKPSPENLKAVSKEIAQYDPANNYIRDWCSISEASRELKIGRSSINKSLQGNQPRGCKFIFKYKK